MSDPRFVGVWKLISTDFVLPNGERFFPYGEHPAGVISYEASGQVSVHIMRSGRPKFASGQMQEGTDEEVRAAFEGYVCYFGTWSVDAAQGTVTHRVEGSLFPNWEGTDQVRRFEFEGNRLSLITSTIPALGATTTATAVWERVS